MIRDYRLGLQVAVMIRAPTIALYLSIDCAANKPRQDLFTTHKWPVAELMVHVLGEELRSDRAIVQQDQLLSFLRLRVMGRKCHTIRKSLEYLT
jgi:hypothetical protein